MSRLRRVAAALTLSTVASALAAAGATPASAADLRLVLVSLHCTTTEDSTGPDEAYLLVNGVRSWGPESVNDGDAEDLGQRVVPFGSTARIGLYDADAGWFDDDDFLGEVTATADMAGQGEQYGDFTLDGASYRVVYRVERG